MTAPEDPVDPGLTDDDVPAESHPTAKADALHNVSAADELVSPEKAIQQAGEVGGKTLTTLLYVHPFTRLFCHLADRHLEEHPHETRVRHYRAEARWFWRLCVLLDFIIVGVVTVVLITAATAVLYKTLWLGP